MVFSLIIRDQAVCILLWLLDCLCKITRTLARWKFPPFLVNPVELWQG